MMMMMKMIMKMMKTTKAEEPSRNHSDDDDDDPPTTTMEDLASFRDWSDIPEALLVSILDRLSFSIPDLAAAASLSRSFLSAASAAAAPSAAAPLLLNPSVSLALRRHSLTFDPRTPRRRILRHHSLTWDPPAPRCRIQALTDTKPYLSPISPQTLTANRHCVGCSNANLIFISGGHGGGGEPTVLDDVFFCGGSVVLADVFSGREIRSPDLPLERSLGRCSGVLTAPLTSSSSLLLVVARDYDSDVYCILCWRPGSSSGWSVLELEIFSEILSLVTVKGRIFGLDSLCRLIVVEFLPAMSWRRLEVHLPESHLILYQDGKFGHHLVECDGELLVVFFASSDKSSRYLCVPKIEVYKLDVENSMWVKKESLGDWSFFIDSIGNCGFSCRDATRWGGRSNCVYVAGPGYDGWSVFPLDEAINVDEESSLQTSVKTLSKWPSPVWVYPSMLL